MSDDVVRRVERLVAQHEAWRQSCLNLVAAENVASPAVKRFALGDLSGRYGDYLGHDLSARKYYGTRFIIEIEQELVALSRRLFRAEYVEFRPLSGHVAGAAVIMGLTQPGDCVLEVGSDGGGHRLTEKLTHTALAKLDVRFLPTDGRAYNIDTVAAIEMIEALRPRLIILGSSNFLFPHPVQAIADALHATVPGGVLAFDASHVLGLIAGGCFQDPLREGADIMFGSTHKTFPGPQGGLIMSQSAELIGRISEACYPGLITNHHLSRSPGLVVALAEMLQYGPAYAQAIIGNARALAGGLAARGMGVVGAERGFTESHTVLLKTVGLGSHKEIAERLESSNIIVNAVMLPAEQGGSGLRLGVQELTRRGADIDFMDAVADLMTGVIKREIEPEAARHRAETLVGTLPGLRFAAGEGHDAAR